MNSSFLFKGLISLAIAVWSIPTDVSSNYASFIEAHYPGGVASFDAQIRQQLVYPSMSKQRCEVGEAIVEVEFGKGSKIKNISFHNAIARPLNLTVIQAIKSTQGSWKAGAEGESLIMSIGFQLGYDDPIGGDIKLKSKQVFGPGKACECTEEIEDRLQTFIGKSQYKKALKECLELLRRYPRSKTYGEWFREIMDNSI